MRTASRRIPLGGGPWAAGGHVHAARGGHGGPVTLADFGPLALPVFPEFSLAAVSSNGTVDAIRMRTSGGAEMIFSVYSAPPSEGILRAFHSSSSEQLERDGASPLTDEGAWGLEVYGDLPDGHRIRYVAVEGQGWLLRGVARSRPERAALDALLLRKVLSYAVVDRGRGAGRPQAPMPLSAEPHWGFLCDGRGLGG